MVNDVDIKISVKRCEFQYLIININCNFLICNCKVASNFAEDIINIRNKITLNSKKINVFRYMLCKFFTRNFYGETS